MPPAARQELLPQGMFHKIFQFTILLPGVLLPQQCSGPPQTQFVWHSTPTLDHLVPKAWA